MIVINYFLSCLKKNSKFIIPSLFFSVIVLSLLLIVFSGFFTDEDKLELPSKAGVGLVGDIDNKTFKTGLSAVKLLDASKDYLELITYENEKQAEDAIRNGQILGYLIVPEDFIKSVLSGKNTPATFVSKNSPVDLLPMIVSDVISTISNLIVESQVGIFAMENFYIENDIANRSKDLNEINLKYISFVLSRDELINVTEINSDGLISLKGYYACVIVILLVLLIGILGAKNCIKNSLSLTRLLSVRGCCSFNQVLSEFISFAVIPILSLFIIFLILTCVYDGMFAEIPELSGFSEFNIFSLFFKIIPAVLLLCSMQFLVYELCSNIVSGTLLQFIVSVGLAYISGCIYPESFFPKTIQLAASFTPVGFSFEYMKSVILDTSDLKFVVLCLSYSMIIIILSALLRSAKIRSRMS